MAPDDIPFDRSISARPGEVQQLGPAVRRIIANNGGPFTFTGTCSYIVGQGDVAIVDPGPSDRSHVAAILNAVRGETVRAILVTHTHRDHSAAAAPLKAATGAALAGPRRRSLAAQDPGHHVSDAGFDTTFVPDRELAEGDVIEVGNVRLVAVETPGHTSDHLAFSLPAAHALFSGDHVMAWSTSVIVPPDGSMRDYMASLRKLIGRDEAVHWPGHGGPVHNPRGFVNALLVHRQWREAAILRCIAAGDATVATIVARVYRDLAPALRAGAAQSVLAHIIDLADRGLVIPDGPPSLKAHYRAS